MESLPLYDQDALVEAVASVNNNTIVVVNTVGPVITEAWVNNINGRPSSPLYSNKKIS